MTLHLRAETTVVAALALNVFLHVVGGLVFSAIELGPEEARALDYQRKSRLLKAEIARVERAAGLTQSGIGGNLTSVIAALQTANAHCKEPDPDDLNWTLEGSAFFSMTLFTTIGYGTFAPHTMGGKMFACLYSLLGISVFTFYLTTITPAVDHVTSGVTEWLAGPPPEMVQNRSGIEASGAPEEASAVSDPTDSSDSSGIFQTLHKARIVSFVPRWIAVIVVVVGVLVSHWEQVISWGNAVYFVTMTLTTIGLGDFAPSFSAKTSNSWGRFTLYTLWVYAGMGLIAYSFTVLAELITPDGILFGHYNSPIVGGDEVSEKVETGSEKVDIQLVQLDQSAEEALDHAEPGTITESYETSPVARKRVDAVIAVEETEL